MIKIYEADEYNFIGNINIPEHTRQVTNYIPDDLLLNFYERLNKDKTNPLLKIMGHKDKKELNDIILKISDNLEYVYTRNRGNKKKTTILETKKTKNKNVEENELEYKDFDSRIKELIEEYKKENSSNQNQNQSKKEEYKQIIQFDKKGFYQDK